MSMQPTVFRDTRAILVESLWWDERTSEMIWVDISAGTLHRGRLDGAVDGSDDTVTELPPPVSAVQPDTAGGFVAALRDRVVRLDAAGDIVETIAHVRHAHAGIRFNEGKVDPFGRFVVGSMNVTSDAPDAALYSVEPDGSVRTLRGGFGVANGFEWSASGDEMFVTDTSTKTVYRGSYDAAGELGELAPFLVGRTSDGLARDTEGRFWNGIYGDHCVACWSDTGVHLFDLPVPAPNVTSVAFGGPRLETLFIGTARENMSEADLEKNPLSGAIFRVDGAGKGRPVHRFGTRTQPDLP